MSEKEKISEEIKILIGNYYYVFNNQGYLLRKRDFLWDREKSYKKESIWTSKEKKS